MEGIILIAVVAVAYWLFKGEDAAKPENQSPQATNAAASSTVLRVEGRRDIQPPPRPATPTAPRTPLAATPTKQPSASTTPRTEPAKIRKQIVPAIRRLPVLTSYPAGRFVVLDFETTGLSPFEGAKVIEVSAREIINGKPGRELCTLIDPEGSVPTLITDLTGISTSMVRGKPRFSEIIDDLCAFIDDAPLVAHNARFDIQFLAYEAERQRVTHRSRHIVCTLLLSRRLFPGMSNYKLGSLSASLGIIRTAELHRASADTFVAAKLFEQIYSQALERSGSRELRWSAVEALQKVQKANVDRWLRTQTAV